MTTKIDWCDTVWNPAWGCKNKCLYCYARKINQRFKKINLGFEPEWIESNFNKKFPKKPSRIFVNSMSDIAFWEYEWVTKVINKILDNPQHTFIILTREPNIYRMRNFPSNCWLGVTINKKSHLRYIKEFIFIDTHKTFLSIEPIQSKIPAYIISETYINWVIIGAETGNRKNKIIPETDWIEELSRLKIPVFMKDNLEPYYKLGLYKEFPK